MSRKIRVLQMIDEASVGGGQMHVLLLSKYLDKNEFDVTIATEPHGYLVDEAKKVGIPTLPITISNSFSIKTLLKMKRQLRQNDFDILHTHGGTAGFWGRAAATLNRSPRAKIHTYHGLHYLSEAHEGRRSFQLADRLALPFTTKLICVCESDFKKGLAAKIVTEKKGVVIHNGIELEKFSHQTKREDLRKEFGVGKDEIVFGTVGRLHKQKAQDILLRAFRMVADQRPNVRLWIVGDGELRSGLERLAQELGIVGKVNFLGERTDIPELLSAMDIFVLSSLWEGQPIVLLEAMASSKPVVTTNVDGIPEIVEDGKSGLLVEAGAAESLSLAMERLLVDSQLRKEFAVKGRDRMSAKFTARHMAERVAQLYRSSLNS